MFAFRPMETIHELNPESPVRANHSDSLGTVMSTPSPKKESLKTARTFPMTRSASTSKVPSMSVKNPSQRVREWMKRSNSTRSAKVIEATAYSPDTEQTVKIIHLGGGRVEHPEFEPTITIGLASATMSSTASRSGLSRTNVDDSRVTQWIDLYPEFLEALSPPLRKGLPSSPATQSQPQQSQPPQETPSSEGDLLPAPLRVPSLKNLRDEAKSNTPEELHVRKPSRWKPLPILPVMMTNSITSTPEPRESPPALEITTSPTPRQPNTHSAHQMDGTPPPTPDSATGTAATTLTSTSTLTLTPTPKPTPAPAGSDNDDDDDTRIQISVGMRCPTQHTRPERVWLHRHYRGEAPFLQAWGLDIKSPDDRAEGLGILRELMEAEGEGGGVWSSEVASSSAHMSRAGSEGGTEVVAFGALEVGDGGRRESNDAKTL
ncbi:hypothetical protein B0T25DRAFT_129080 [Lasiosphaeria hispida]|uniref:Uncharacterized protein n=1 Tax=Lasiosphaeria hispida TaxID=260671 RepID=A0AAJ0HS91_9PEZI|nr:hypothetical protein B0T25DRAFT_129080 [Lasiosphaeria hispida]